jgi:hypothetical protein
VDVLCACTYATITVVCIASYVYVLAHEYIISLLGHCVIYNIPCFFSLNAESVVFVI